MRRSEFHDSAQITLNRLMLSVACLALAVFCIACEMRAECTDFRLVIGSLPTAGALVFAAVGTLFGNGLRAMAAGYMAICMLECLIVVCFWFRMGL